MNAFIKEKFKVESEEKRADYSVETLTNPEFTGQMVRKKRIPLMFSFVKTRNWLSDPNQQRLAQAENFRM